jgi:hypothetical protein
MFMQGGQAAGGKGVAAQRGDSVGAEEVAAK